MTVERLAAGKRLKLGNPAHCMHTVCATHDRLGAQAAAHFWTLWFAENGAAIVIRQLRTANTGRLALRHAWNR